MTTNFLTRGLQRLSQWWPREQHALRTRRQQPRGYQDSIPALIELLEPRKVLTSTVFTNATPVPIPDNGPQVFSDITVAGVAGVINQVNVRINIEYTYDLDLRIFLIAPGGGVFELSTGNGGSSDNYVGTVFTSAGAGSITAGTAPFTGTFAPEGSLASLIGASPNGTWRLRVQDATGGGDVGTILDWSLELTTSPKTFTNTTDVPIPDNGLTHSSLVVSGVSGTVSNIRVGFNITHTFDADLDIFLVSPAGTVLELSTDNGSSFNNYTDTFIQTSGGFPSITTGTAPFTGTFSPEGSIAILQGQNPNGTWQLRVVDDAGGDVGTLLDWSLAFLSGPTPAVNASFTASQAGSTLLITSPQPDYDASSLTLHFSPAGLMVTANSGTTVNGLTGALPLFAGVTAITGFFGNGDDNLTVDSTGGTLTQQSVSLFLSGGNNSVGAEDLNVAGGTLVEASAGRIALNTHGGTYHGLTVIGGTAADSVGFLNTHVIGATTLLLGGGNSRVQVDDNSSLGATTIIGSNQITFTSFVSVFASLTVLSGAGIDDIYMSTSPVHGSATFLLGGGASTVSFGALTIDGAVFIESGLGGVTFTANTVTLGSLLIIGGSTRDDTISFEASNVNGSTTLLLGGGRNTVKSIGNLSTFSGQVFLESGAGRLVANLNLANLNGGLLLIGGSTQNDNLTFTNVNFFGQTTLLLGGGGDTVTAEHWTTGPITVISSSATTVNVEINAPNALGSQFGAVLFLVGAGSSLNFGNVPSDLTTFTSTLTIFSSAPTTLRRRNVTNNGAVTLVGVTQI